MRTGRRLGVVRARAECVQPEGIVLPDRDPARPAAHHVSIDRRTAARNVVASAHRDGSATAGIVGNADRDGLKSAENQRRLRRK